MSENNEANKGSLQATGQTSDGGPGSTSDAKTRTYTDEEVAKQVSDALAKAGRDAKALETKAAALKAEEAALEANRAKIAKWDEDREREELEAAKDSPEALTLLQRKQALRKREAEFAESQAAFTKAKAEHDAELQEARDAKRESAIWKIAGDDIDPVKLKDMCDTLNAQTEEQIKKIADNIRPEKKGADGKPIPGKDNKGFKTIKGDSGVTTGVVPGTSPRDKVSRGLEKLRK